MHDVDHERTREELLAEVRSLRAEVAALGRSEALLRAVVDGIEEPVYAKDERGRYLLANAAAAERLGMAAAEMLGKTVDELFPPDEARRMGETTRRVIAEGRSVCFEEVVATAAGPRTFFTTKSPHRDGRGRVIGVVGSSRDITERVRAGADLARQKEALQTIFDHIPVVINFLDHGGRLLMVNREWERLLGWSLAEAQACDIVAELYPDPGRRAEALDYVLRPPPGWKDFPVRARDGRSLAISWANVLLSDGTSIGIGLDVTERASAEEAVRSRERQFRAVFDGALDAMVLADDGGRYVDANPAACALFGLPREQLLGRTVADFAGAGFDAGAAWGVFRRAIAALGTFRLHRPDGTVRETEYAATADILPDRHLSILRDVTERARAEAALRESERRVVTILESITDGFFTLDRRWCIRYVNARAEPLLARSREQLLGRDFWQVFPQGLGTTFEREYRRAMDQAVPVAFEEFYPPLGRWFNVHAYPSADGLSVYFTDATERHRAEEALKRSEGRLRLVLENSRDVVYQLNLATRTYDYLSPSTEDVLGYSCEAFTAGGLAFVLARVHPEDLARWEGHVARLLAPRPGDVLEPRLDYRMRVPGAGWRWMSDHSKVIRDEAGTPAMVVGNLRDVTELIRAEERLRDLSRRLIRAQEEERRLIARELHDEIGQALTALKLNIRGALRDPAAPATARRLEDCLGLIDRTIAQVRDLSLDLRPPMLDDLGLVDALRSCVADFARRSGIAAEYAADEGLDRPAPDVETACYRIAQEALTNVARHSGAGRVRVALARAGPDLALVVADDGPGFDVPAATARAAAGTSLGLLSMCERATIVGGSVVIDSHPGRGTEVRATLPSGRARPDARGDPPGG